MDRRETYPTAYLLYTFKEATALKRIISNLGEMVTFTAFTLTDKNSYDFARYWSLQHGNRRPDSNPVELAAISWLLLNKAEAQDRIAVVLHAPDGILLDQITQQVELEAAEQDDD